MTSTIVAAEAGTNMDSSGLKHLMEARLLGGEWEFTEKNSALSWTIIGLECATVMRNGEYIHPSQGLKEGDKITLDSERAHLLVRCADILLENIEKFAK